MRSHVTPRGRLLHRRPCHRLDADRGPTGDTRGTLPGLLFGFVLSVTALASAGCQAPPPQEPKVASITHIKDNLYLITGGGGNTAALVTDAGVVLVDTKLRGWGQAILDKVRTVTDKPVTTIINTHAHGDHVLSNPFFVTATEIVAHQRTKETMARLADFQGANARFLPNRTYTDRMSLSSGHDRIDLYYFGAGHTGGDTIVVFPALRVAHTGDLFSAKTPPIIERLGGGSGLAYPQTLARAVADIPDVDRIITGHADSLLTWKDLQEYADFNRDFLVWTQAQFSAGTSAGHAADAYVMPAKYSDYTDKWRVTTNVRTIYDELNHTAPRSFRRPWWKIW